MTCTRDEAKFKPKPLLTCNAGGVPRERPLIGSSTMACRAHQQPPVTQPRAAFFVQPHYDDVALSCGATAAACASNGCDAHIVTVFASELVDAMVGDFAHWKHERWGLSDPDLVQRERRAEDAAAAAVLNCRLRWLGLPDAIYRGDRYTNDGQLYGPLHPDEHALAVHLACELVQLPECTPLTEFFVPLAVGGHVDHRLVFEAGRALARGGRKVWAYEDAPYAIHTPGATAQRLTELGPSIGPEEPRCVDDSFETKLQAVACYRSQLPVISASPRISAAPCGRMRSTPGTGRLWASVSGRYSPNLAPEAAVPSPPVTLHQSSADDSSAAVSSLPAMGEHGRSGAQCSGHTSSSPLTCAGTPGSWPEVIIGKLEPTSDPLVSSDIRV